MHDILGNGCMVCCRNLDCPTYECSPDYREVVRLDKDFDLISTLPTRNDFGREHVHIYAKFSHINIYIYISHIYKFSHMYGNFFVYIYMYIYITFDIIVGTSWLNT